MIWNSNRDNRDEFFFLSIRAMSSEVFLFTNYSQWIWTKYSSSPHCESLLFDRLFELSISSIHTANQRRSMEKTNPSPFDENLFDHCCVDPPWPPSAHLFSMFNETFLFVKSDWIIQPMIFLSSNIDRFEYIPKHCIVVQEIFGKDPTTGRSPHGDEYLQSRRFPHWSSFQMSVTTEQGQRFVLKSIDRHFPGGEWVTNERETDLVNAWHFSPCWTGISPRDASTGTKIFPSILSVLNSINLGGVFCVDSIDHSWISCSDKERRRDMAVKRNRFFPTRRSASSSTRQWQWPGREEVFRHISSLQQIFVVQCKMKFRWGNDVQWDTVGWNRHGKRSSSTFLTCSSPSVQWTNGHLSTEVYWKPLTAWDSSDLWSIR